MGLIVRVPTLGRGTLRFEFERWPTGRIARFRKAVCIARFDMGVAEDRIAAAIRMLR